MGGGGWGGLYPPPPPVTQNKKVALVYSTKWRVICVILVACRIQPCPMSTPRVRIIFGIFAFLFGVVAVMLLLLFRHDHGWI